LLFDHPFGDAKTTGTPITNKKEITIRANTANWKAMITLNILQTYSKIKFHILQFFFKKIALKQQITPFIIKLTNRCLSSIELKHLFVVVLKTTNSVI
jgi:hypothetical protein